MPRDINGVYTLPAGNPVVPGTVISTTWANSTLNDIAAALTASITQTAADARYANVSGDTFTGPVTVPSLNGGQLAGFRNKIINGKMDIAQRGTSFPAATLNSYTLDRWVIAGAGTDAVVNISQAGGGNTGFGNSLSIGVATAGASIAAPQSLSLQHRIEGFNVRDLVGATFTLSFCVYATKVGTYCVSFANSGTDRSYVAEFTINSSNTWETKTISVIGGIPSSGTWDFTTGIGLTARWALAAGTSFHTTAGAWQTGNFQSTANQVNCLDTVGNIFAITGVQLEVGLVATPFEHRPYGAELSLCQWYYNKLLIIDGFYRYVPTAGTFAVATQVTPLMRAAPTITPASYSLTGVLTGAAFFASVGSIKINGTASGAGEGGVSGNPVIVLSAEL